MDAELKNRIRNVGAFLFLNMAAAAVLTALLFSCR